MGAAHGCVRSQKAAYHGQLGSGAAALSLSTAFRCTRSSRRATSSVLLPGVISHASNVVEQPEIVAERLVRLARLIGRENVIASTDCGFAQGPFTRRVHPSIMWAKLRALSEGAALASRELWGKAAA